MPKSLIGLGANLNHRETVLRDVVRHLGSLQGVTLLGSSRVYETNPIGGPSGQNAFLNAVVLIDSEIDPSSLLAILQTLENTCGRVRDARWGPRVIDLDLLLYGDVNIELPNLILPHPRMTFRRFVLHPACDIASDIIHPTTGRTLGQLLNHLDKSPNYIVFRGGTERDRKAIIDDAEKKLAPHKITLGRKLTKGVPTGEDSGAWVLIDQNCDFSAGESKIESLDFPPKLVVFLDFFNHGDQQYQSLNSVSFSGPRLQLTHSNRTQISAGDDVAAAILAMTKLPRPMNNLSLDDP